VFPTYKTDKLEGDNTYICKLYRDKEHIETGKGISKKKSEQDASRRALIKFCVISE